MRSGPPALPDKDTTGFMSESSSDQGPPRPDKGGDGDSTPPSVRAPKKRPSGAARRKARAERRKANPDAYRVGGPRHQARILAMQALFELDETDHELAGIQTRIEHDDDLPPPVKELTLLLVSGSAEHLGEIDPLIAEAAPAFPLPQLAGTDRAVLRLAVFELLHRPEVPMKAAINEAVEIAKHYGGANSGRFVNGVLGTIAERVGRTASDAAPEG
jgi:N utilization substance protein B